MCAAVITIGSCGVGGEEEEQEVEEEEEEEEEEVLALKLNV